MKLLSGLLKNFQLISCRDKIEPGEFDVGDQRHQHVAKPGIGDAQVQLSQLNLATGGINSEAAQKRLSNIHADKSMVVG